MSEVLIRVRGSHDIRVAAELAVAAVSVRVDGPQRADVVSRATAASAAVSASLTDLADAGAVTRWNSGQLSARSDRPWNHEGKQLAPVHTAHVSFNATFVDFDALGVWLGRTGADDLSIDGVEWTLTPETRARLERAAAAAAVQAAVARARAYAEALDLKTVRPTQIADGGLLAAEPTMRMDRAAFMTAESGAAFELTPDSLTVSSTVEASFSAS